MDIFEKALEYFNREDIRAQAEEDLAKIVAVPSVAEETGGEKPYGKEPARALDTVKELAEKYGFEFQNHDYRCASVFYGKGAKDVGIVTHVDVVPASEGWQSDPYKMVVADDKFIGRGTNDDKGPFIQSLYTLRFLKENNIELPFRVRLIVGSGEEIGCADLDHFKSTCRVPDFSFTPDSEYPVCIGEKGILTVNVVLGKLQENIKELSGGTVPNAVPFEAHAIVETDRELKNTEFVKVEKTGKLQKITASGLAAHASTPEKGRNAIGVLADYMLANGLLDDGDSKKSFEFIKDSCTEYLGKTLGIDGRNDAFGYLTCIGGVLKVVNGKIVQNFNIRYLPEFSASQMAEKIENKLKGTGFTLEVLDSSEGYSVSADDEKIKALTEACESVLKIPCKPYTMGGGTYARSLPHTVAFGAAIISERSHFGPSRGGPHQCDEYMTKREFYDGMNIFVRALVNLSKVIR